MCLAAVHPCTNTCLQQEGDRFVQSGEPVGGIDDSEAKIVGNIYIMYL